jgi:conjugal transfer pilus assembly protein TraB
MPTVNVKQWWATLDATKKRYVYFGGIGAAVLAVLVLGSGSREKPERRAVAEKPSVRVLASDRGEADIAQLNAAVQALRKEVGDLKGGLSDSQERVQRLQTNLSGMSGLKANPEQLNTLIDEVNRIKTEQEALKSAGGVPGGLPRAPVAGPPGNKEAAPPSVDPLRQVKGSLGAEMPPGGTAPAADESPMITIDGGGARASGEARIERTSNVRTAGTRVSQTSRDFRGEQVSKPEEPSVFIPSGTLFKGVLINGMDAPTGRNATSDPFPATIRLTSLAFLPNFFTTNVRECFVLSAGTGRLDDERVHLRTERLSCVTTTGRIIDIALEGYVTGEDGKVGVRGTVVEKTGALLGRAALAGLGAGLADALRPRVRPSVQTGGEAGDINFTAPDTAEVLEVGAYAGASKALDMIAEFYLHRAEQIFPVIELDAMRQVTVHLTKGAELKLRESTAWNQLAR